MSAPRDWSNAEVLYFPRGRANATLGFVTKGQGSEGVRAVYRQGAAFADRPVELGELHECTKVVREAIRDWRTRNVGAFDVDDEYRIPIAQELDPEPIPRDRVILPGVFRPLPLRSSSNYPVSYDSEAPLDHQRLLALRSADPEYVLPSVSSGELDALLITLVDGPNEDTVHIRCVVDGALHLLTVTRLVGQPNIIVTVPYAVSPEGYTHQGFLVQDIAGFATYRVSEEDGAVAGVPLLVGGNSPMRMCECSILIHQALADGLRVPPQFLSESYLHWLYCLAHEPLAREFCEQDVYPLPLGPTWRLRIA